MRRVEHNALAVPKRFASLVIAWSRARVLRAEWEKEDRKIRRDTKRKGAGEALALSELTRWLTFYSLWLACLYVVVEGYRESVRDSASLLYSPRIEELLADEEREKTLRSYRNKILHPEPYDHPAISKVQREYRKFAVWAAMLTDEFDRLFAARLKT